MYFLRTAMFGMARALSFTLISTLTLAAALWVMGVFCMTLLGARTCVQAWGRGGHVSLGIAAEVPRERWPALQALVAEQPGVQLVQLVPPEEALASFRARGPVAAQLVEGVEPQMLPASLTVVPEASLVDARALEQLALRLAHVPGVEDVDYGAMAMERMRAAVRWSAVVLVGLGCALAVAMTFMVMNTVRLVLAGRQEEVRILRLVGATAWFVRLPFLIEGGLSGVLAGTLAAGGLFALQLGLARPLAELSAYLGTLPLSLFSWPAVAAQLTCGTVIGLLASHVAVAPFLAQDVG